jgi:hypothetical protein
MVRKEHLFDLQGTEGGKMKRVPVKGFEGLYEVDDQGIIFGLKRTVSKGKCHRSWDEHPLKYGVDHKGYFRTNLAKDGVNRTVKVHRIVAEAFIPNPMNLPQVNHKDGNKQNNCVENLEWCTRSENIRHAYENGLIQKRYGALNHTHKLTPEEVDFIRTHYIPRHSDFGTVALGNRFRVHRKTITRIINNQSWKAGDAICPR